MPSKPGQNKKQKEQQDLKNAEESFAEGSSESELDLQVKETEECSDKEVKKQPGASHYDQTETIGEIEVGVSTVFTIITQLTYLNSQGFSQYSLVHATFVLRNRK